MPRFDEWLVFTYMTVTGMGAWQARDLVSDRGYLEDPKSQFLFLYLRATCWVLLYPAVGLPFVGIAAVIVHFGVGTHLEARVFAFGATVCVVGVLDSLWRLYLTRAAEKRMRRGRTAPVERLLLWARVNDGSILIQLASGLIIAWLV